jgi:hypothetical protein
LKGVAWSLNEDGSPVDFTWPLDKDKSYLPRGFHGRSIKKNIISKDSRRPCIVVCTRSSSSIASPIFAH